MPPKTRVYVQPNPVTGQWEVREMTALEALINDIEYYGLDVAMHNLDIINGYSDSEPHEEFEGE